MTDDQIIELVDALDGLMQLRAYEAVRTPPFHRPYPLESVENAIKVQREHLRRLLAQARNDHEEKS
jgi:hypothetical protein